MSAQAYVIEAVRRGIATGELLPGERLIEGRLGDSLGVSRGMVRAALMKLVHEGLLEQIPNAGVRVRVIGRDEAAQTAEVCLALQSLCAAKAARTIKGRDLTRLRRIGTALTRAARARDVAAFAEAAAEFDELLVRVSGHRVATDVVGRLRVRLGRTWQQALSCSGGLEAAARRYEAVIDAIACGDAEHAQAAMNAHAEAFLTGLGAS